MSVTVKAEINFVCVDCGKQLHFIEEHPEWEEYTRIRIQSCDCAVADRDAAIARAVAEEGVGWTATFKKNQKVSG